MAGQFITKIQDASNVYAIKDATAYHTSGTNTASVVSSTTPVTYTIETYAAGTAVTAYKPGTNTIITAITNTTGSVPSTTTLTAGAHTITTDDVVLNINNANVTTAFSATSSSFATATYGNLSNGTATSVVTVTGISNKNLIKTISKNITA